MENPRVQSLLSEAGAGACRVFQGRSRLRLCVSLGTHWATSCPGALHSEHRPELRRGRCGENRPSGVPPPRPGWAAIPPRWGWAAIPPGLGCSLKWATQRAQDSGASEAHRRCRTREITRLPSAQLRQARLCSKEQVARPRGPRQRQDWAGSGGGTKSRMKQQCPRHTVVSPTGLGARLQAECRALLRQRHSMEEARPPFWARAPRTGTPGSPLERVAATLSAGAAAGDSTGDSILRASGARGRTERGAATDPLSPVPGSRH